jgi:hypothetical protein
MAIADPGAVERQADFSGSVFESGASHRCYRTLCMVGSVWCLRVTIEFCAVKRQADLSACCL